MTHDLVHQLFRHMEWADALVWAEVLGHPETYGDEKLRELLVHIATVQQVYVAIGHALDGRVEALATSPEVRQAMRAEAGKLAAAEPPARRREAAMGKPAEAPA